MPTLSAQQCTFPFWAVDKQVMGNLSPSHLSPPLLFTLYGSSLSPLRSCAGISLGMQPCHRATTRNARSTSGNFKPSACLNSSAFWRLFASRMNTDRRVYAENSATQASSLSTAFCAFVFCCAFLQTIGTLSSLFLVQSQCLPCTCMGNFQIICEVGRDSLLPSAG